MAFSLILPSHHDVYPFIDPRENLKGAATGKSILVTGAGTGIGKGIAEQFALAGAARIVVAARRTGPLEDTKRSIESLAPSCQVVVRGDTDVADAEAVKRLFESLEPLPDVLVHNAAVSLSTAAVPDSEPSKWLGDMDINIHGMYNMTHVYINALKAAGKTTARIINISSNASWRYVHGRSSYAMSKVAMNSFTEYVDSEQQDLGTDIRCVALHPGGVRTSLSEMLPEPVQRILVDTPELPGATAVYLSTGRANFVMGRFVGSTWDMEELESLKDKVVKEDLLRTRVVGCEWRP
ncbi:Fc.00g040890.m01.CDS01 [Cosmosporella sp. VM-42]